MGTRLLHTFLKSYDVEKAEVITPENLENFPTKV